MQLSARCSLVLAFVCAALLYLPCHAAETSVSTGAGGVRITEQPTVLRVEINGKLLTEYHFKDVPRPYFYPLMGPGDVEMTRDWPMKNRPQEDHDHPHHRSLWFAHGAVDGKDFWSEQAGFGKIVHEAFDEIKSGAESGVIRDRNKWVDAEGKTVCTDSRIFRVYNNGSKNERLFDFEITIHASQGDVTFGDTKEGSMAVRVSESMKLKGHDQTSHIVQSTGVRDNATWGKRADWCDYFGQIDGKTVGIAMFDHPQNPRHPTWWHVRDYGLFAANPFGRHDFEHLKDKAAGDFVIPAGQSAVFRYRFYLHEGDEQQAKVAERYQEYTKSR